MQTPSANVQNILNLSNALTQAEIKTLIYELKNLSMQKKYNEEKNRQTVLRTAARQLLYNPNLGRATTEQFMNKLLSTALQNGFEYTANNRTISGKPSPAGKYTISEHIRLQSGQGYEYADQNSLLRRLFGPVGGMSRGWDSYYSLQNASDEDVRDVLLAIISDPDFDPTNFKEL